MGFRTGDREEQIFLPRSLGQDRGSSDPVAQRQRKGTVEVKVSKGKKDVALQTE